MRPAAQSLFLPKKVTKNGSPCCLRPLRCAARQPASGHLRGAPWNSLRCYAAAFEQPRRASQRSMRAPARMPPRKHPAAGASTRAGNHTGLCCARPGKKRRAAMGRTCFSPGRAQQWPVRISEPLWPCREAQGRADQGSRLFEHRRCELSETPSGTSIAGCPKRSAGTRTVGRAFFGDFLSLERKLMRRRAHTPAPALRQTHALHSLSGAAIKFHKITL